MHGIPLTSDALDALLEVVGEDFETAAVVRRARAAGWACTPTSSDNYGFGIELPDRFHLQLDPIGARLIWLMHPIALWEEYDRESYADDASFRRARAVFDRLLNDAIAVVVSRLGPPVWRHTDDDDDAYGAVAWSRPSGCLIAQQACFDPQFGVQVDLTWLPVQPVALPDRGIFVDWVTERSIQQHEQHGYPPLPS